jgi:protein involved in sex pheromone biosynthesis
MTRNQQPAERNHAMKSLIVAACLMLSACAPMSDDTARNALESAGLHDIQLHGIAFFGCAEKDFFRKKFTAKNADGKVVEGVVCGGFLKGSTVRYD